MDESIYPSRVTRAIPGISRTWMLALGILMVVLGVIGLGMTYSLAAAVLFWSGILAMVAGASNLIDAYHHKAWQGVVWHRVVGVIYILVGLLLTAMPSESAFWITKLIAVSLVLTGIMRLVMMLLMREWRGLQFILLLSAVLSIALGIYIFQLVGSPDPEMIATADARAAWVRSWKWVIGLFVAIELITEGITLISISLSAKAERET